MFHKMARFDAPTQKTNRLNGNRKTFKLIFGFVMAMLAVSALWATTALAANQPVRATHAQRAALVTPTPPFVQDSDSRVWLNGWGGGTLSGYTYRASTLQSQTTSFTFSGTSVKLLADRLKMAGIAQVWIDGVSKGKFDLYAPLLQQYHAPLTFSGLANNTHTITVQNTGTKSAFSTGTSISLDGFTVGSTNYTANSHKITYGDWKGVFNSNALGGSYRYASSSTAQALLNFSGTNIAWITAMGPSYGKAWVIIDGVSRGYVDLYSATQKWQIVKWYTVGAGSHSIQIQVLGQKNSNSTGYAVVLDAFLPN